MNKIAKLSVVGLVGLCATANAKTIAWYRFDDAQVGTKANGQSAFLNAVDPAKYPGYFRTWSPDPRVHPENYPPVITDGESEYYPDYTNAFPSSVRILDPVSDTLYANDSALQVNNANVGSAAAAGSILLVDDHEDLHLQTFTIEFYLRIRPEVSGSTSWRFILQKPTAGGNMISLYLQNAAYLYCSLMTSEKSYTQNTGAVAVNDGKWHHVAIVVNDATKTFTFVTDKTVKSVTYAGELNYDGAGAMCFCNSSKGYYGSWQGGIDEIRISDVALSTSEMLALVEGPSTVSACVTPETLLYVDFEGSAESATYDELATGIRPATSPEALWNKAQQNSPLKSSAVINYVTSATRPKVLETGWFTDNVPYDQSRAGLASTNFALNAASFHSGTNAAANGEKMSIARLEVADSDRILFSDSFTLEFDLRIGAGPIEVAESAYAYIMMQTGAFTIRCNTLGRIYVSDGVDNAFVFSRAYNGTANTFERYDDGKWHHLALVYDKPSAKGIFYIDGELRATRTNANFFGPQTTGNGSKNLCVLGGFWGEDYRFNNADVDSLRIVRGALNPYQFLTTRPIEGPSLGTAAFDVDVTLGPYADFFPAAVPAAFTATGMLPTVDEGAKAGRLVYDGKGGSLVREKNCGSMRFSGGMLTYPSHNLVADTAKVTVEFFVKTFAAAETGAGLVRLNRDSADAFGSPAWAISFADATGKLKLTVDTDGQVGQEKVFDVAVADGKWHHVALVLDETDGHSAAKLFCDYVEAGACAFVGKIGSRFSASNLMLGAGADAMAGFDGWIDELRITPGALLPEQFLRAENCGMIILFR